jgi:hypothetical protein
MKAFWVIWSCLFLSFMAAAGSISLSTDIELPAPAPDPNAVITVWIHSDAPVFFMNVLIRVNGDATITGTMNETDGTDYGWESDFVPVITDNSIQFFGVNWNNNDNGTIGYLTFRCNSGRVSVYIDTNASFVFSWTESFTYSPDPIIVGTLTLPPLIKPNRPEPVLIEGPAHSDGPPRDGMYYETAWPQQMSMLTLPDSGATVIEIDSDITINQVWEASNVYYLTEPNGINVQALLVIKPGTTIIMGSGCGLFVNNGGALIAKGTPNERITFIPDFIYFFYPNYVGYYWQLLPSTGPYYYSPICIQDTASPATTVQYCMAEGAIAGIITANIRLDHPIENNYLTGNVFGIFEFGPKTTDIRNNLCFYNDVAGIEVYLCPDPNAAPDTEMILKIEHNTCDTYQLFGISIYGVLGFDSEDPNEVPDEVPTVYLLNNIVSSSYWYGLNHVGWTKLLVMNTGYYDNADDKNWAFDEYGPVVAEDFPYWPYGGEKPHQHHYLSEDSPFVNAGTQYIEQTKLIGMTTNFDSLPDKDIVDLGFHHMDWDYTGVEEVTGTDIDDVLTLANYWLTYTPYEPNSPNYMDPNIIDPNLISYGGDWNDDGFVDLADFAILAANWQRVQGNPDITASVVISDEDGSIEVQVQNNGEPIYQYFVLIDGLYAKELMFSDGLFHQNIYMPWLSPGLHEARIIGAGQQGIVCSTVISFEIDNAIGPCIVPLMFEMGAPLSFFVNSGVDVRVSAWVSGQEVWSQSYPSGMVQGAVPAAVTDANDIEFLMIEPATQFAAMRAGAGVSPVAVPVVSADDDSGEYTALMIRPYIKINFFSGLADHVHEKLVEMGYKVKKLRYYNSSFENVKKYIDRGTIKVLYYNGHGNYIYPETNIKRSVLGLDDGNIVSDKVSNYPPGQAPSWLEPLPPKIEASVKTWRELNLKDLKFAAFDACDAMMLRINSQGKLVESPNYNDVRGDLSAAVLQRPVGVPCFVFGWAPDFVSGTTTPWQGFSSDLWKKLAEGKTLAEAISYAYSEAPAEVRNGYRLQGNGNSFDFKL